MAVWWLRLGAKEDDKVKLEWNVYTEDFNSREIKIFNIFNHARVCENVKKALKKFDNKAEFAEEVRKTLIWCYWSKCEWEIIITSFPARITKEELDRLNKESKDDAEKYGCEPRSMWISPSVGKKVDVYEQIMLNWNAFIDYLWAHKTKKVENT